MDPQVASMIDEAKQKIVQRAGGHLRLLVLYGSEARGEATPESDIDLLALLEADDLGLETALSDAAYDVMWKYDFSRLISLHFMSITDFEAQKRDGYSFVRNVEQEGIVLWPAA